MFYVTSLDVGCSAVLGHSWLTHYNLLIDWVLGSIMFRPPKETESLVSPVLATPASGTPNSVTDISLIGAAAFAQVSRLADVQVFKLFISTLDPRDLDTTLVDVSNVLSKYHEFRDVFSKSRANTLLTHQPYDLKIKLEDGVTPPFGPIYSLSLHELQTLREFIYEHLANGLIHPTYSPSRAPVLFKKKDGSLRLCVNFQGLNKITKKDQYPLPQITDLLDSPRKARFYSKINLRHAYHLIQIHKDDEWKTTFCTCYGSFEWCAMPFRLTNAPATFQHLMNNAFSDLLDICVLVYLDNILIHSNTLEEYHHHVHELLLWLQNNKLYACGDKSSLHDDTIKYLGFILSPDGLLMDPSKVSTVLEWPEPHKVKDIQSFLGFANFYRQFISDYSKITVPLTRLTCKGTPWDFSNACRNTFKSLGVHHSPSLG